MHALCVNQRSNIGKQLQNNGNPSKLWHEALNALSNDDFENGYLKEMGNSKNVYKTIMCEEAMLQLPEQDLLSSLRKLKTTYEDTTEQKLVKGFIQSLSIDPLAITLWNQEDVEFFHVRGEKYPLIVNATCGIVAKVNEKGSFTLH